MIKADLALTNIEPLSWRTGHMNTLGKDLDIRCSKLTSQLKGTQTNPPHQGEHAQPQLDHSYVGHVMPSQGQWGGSLLHPERSNSPSPSGSERLIEARRQVIICSSESPRVSLALLRVCSLSCCLLDFLISLGDRSL